MTLSNNQKTLQQQFETIQQLDTPKAKKQHYTKSYYYKNKARYQKYYQENKEAIKEYAKNYKQHKIKKIVKKQGGMTIRRGSFVVSFNVGPPPTQSKTLVAAPDTQCARLLQFFRQCDPSADEAHGVSFVLLEQVQEQDQEQPQEEEWVQEPVVQE